jgi:hypothetical protein
MNQRDYKFDPSDFPTHPPKLFQVLVNKGVMAFLAARTLFWHRDCFSSFP